MSGSLVLILILFFWIIHVSDTAANLSSFEFSSLKWTLECAWRVCAGCFCQGVKEVTLLGQNVNSYRDTSDKQVCGSDATKLSRGFKTVYQTKRGGLRFSDLLDQVSRIDPNVRIRFTSPHPKDFPDEVFSLICFSSFGYSLGSVSPAHLVCVSILQVLHLIAERGNICKQIHLPAQSGSSRVLKAMRRG